MGLKGRVNHNERRRNYGARDKEDYLKAIKDLYNQGFSQNEIADMIDVPRGTISRWMLSSGIEGRHCGEAGKLKSKIYDYDENYFSSINTPNKAYIAGFILGDGCISDKKKSKRLVIALALEDKQLLTDIAREMDAEDILKIRNNKATNEQDKISLNISSTQMCNDLISLGIVPSKTGKESWIDFNDNKLQWAFIRGFFDADGHVGSYGKDQISRVGFTGSYDMLASLLEYLKSYDIGKRVNAITKKVGCYDLRISSKKDLKKLFDLMYRYGDLKLNRKYEKFSSLMI